MINRIVIFLFLLCLSAFVQAQVSSESGRFSISQNKGCDPLTITINTTDPECDVSCTALFGDGNSRTVVDGDTYTYDTPGNYTLSIVFTTTGTDRVNLQITPNVEPEFDLYSCGGNGVQVKINDSNYDQYVVNFGDGTEITTALKSVNHGYGSAGNKNIMVRGKNLNAEDNCNGSTEVINALSSLPTPVITQLTVLDEGSIQLDFNNQPNILYKLQFGVNSGTSFLPLRDIYNTNSVVINSIKPDDNFYCFRLGAFDPCNNTTSYSNIICSANFDLTVENNNNRLHWTTSEAGNLSTYTIYKNPGSIFGAGSSLREYNDSDIRCGTEYTYQLQSNYPNGSRSLSLSKSGTAMSTDIPSVIDNISSIVDGNSVQLQWQQNPDFTPETYTIFRSVNENFTTYDNSTAPVFTDNAYNTEAGLCYKIQYEDVCGNQSSLSGAVCPVQLTGALDRNNTITLSWPAYNGWVNGVSHYVVEKYDAHGNLIESIDTGTGTALVLQNDDYVNQVYIFRITAYSNDALPASVSNTIVLIKEPSFFFPTAFTPNDDGLNDVFEVHSQYTQTFEMQIFNRWGELLFTTDDISIGWDGTFKGDPMPEGTYIFKAKIKDLAGRTFDRSGSIVLLRKN